MVVDFSYIKDAGLTPARAYTKRKKTNLIILHHVQGNMSVQAVHAMHVARGHKGIDYNIYIDKDGTVYWGRGLEYVGGHTLDRLGYNDRSVGIVCNGDFQAEQMGEAQKEALVHVMRDVCAQYGITDVRGHREVSDTDCPGRYFPLEEVRACVCMQQETPEAFVIDHLLKRRSPTVYDPQVQWVQEAFLRAGGEYITLLGSAGADGRFGSGTEKAVKSYQRALGLQADGIVGHDTAVSLGAVWQG